MSQKFFSKLSSYHLHVNVLALVAEKANIFNGMELLHMDIMFCWKTSSFVMGIWQSQFFFFFFRFCTKKLFI